MTSSRPSSSSTVDRELARRLRRRLVAWYRRAARDLPWRRTADPYAIWISEAMLQQTRVETVVDYWRRFLERFPTVEALAAAAEEDVLAAWSGLGYYSRARALRAAAGAIVERHAGVFPRTRAEAVALPGVGEYTAGAVLSIAHGLPEALVDGNVERVFARLFDLELRAASPALKRAAWALARELVPARGAGEWNQALMELGATVCTPTAPRCAECALEPDCDARSAGRASERPLPKVRRAPTPVAVELALARRGDALLVERRPAGGRMAGLWQLPTRQLPEPAADEVFSREWPWGGEGALGETLAELSHSITRYAIRARLAPLEQRLPRGIGGEAGEARAAAKGATEDAATGETERARDRLAWRTPAELASLPVTGMTKKVLALLARAAGGG